MPKRPQPIEYKRPVAILYYTDARGGLPIAQGSCLPTAKMADGRRIKDASWKRAAAAQVFAFEHYRRAEVVDRKTSTLLCVLRRTATGEMTVDYSVAGEDAKNYQWRAKMDAKRKGGR
jgi:dipeptidyl aminopeptidase/acylaminoacyl peptidase